LFSFILTYKKGLYNCTGLSLLTEFKCNLNGCKCKAIACTRYEFNVNLPITYFVAVH